MGGTRFIQSTQSTHPSQLVTKVQDKGTPISGRFSEMDPPKAKETLQSPPPSSSSVHKDDADEEDENVKQLQECSVLYLSLQDCLVQNNRNWKSCQLEVQALKACHERRNKDKRKEES